MYNDDSDFVVYDNHNNGNNNDQLITVYYIDDELKNNSVNCIKMLIKNWYTLTISERKIAVNNYFLQETDLGIIEKWWFG